MHEIFHNHQNWCDFSPGHGLDNQCTNFDFKCQRLSLVDVKNFHIGHTYD